MGTSCVSKHASQQLSSHEQVMVDDMDAASWKDAYSTS